MITKIPKSKAIKAYKGFNKDWSCLEKQYAVGETFVEKGDITLCMKGIHSCLHLEDCTTFYPEKKFSFCRSFSMGRRGWSG